jgi:hypothetical protein
MLRCVNLHLTCFSVRYATDAEVRGMPAWRNDACAHVQTVNPNAFHRRMGAP